MDVIEAILLGIVQGLTEFLPVSSSGHLQIAKDLLGVELENNITFDVTLHAATVFSTMLVLWRELWQLLRGVFSRRFNAEQAYVLKILISMIPAGIVGVLFSEQLEALFSSLGFVGAMLIVTAVLLTFAYYAKPRVAESADVKPFTGISWLDAFIIGCAQAVATLPGLSRSGTTIATGLILGKRKSDMATFSFIMVIPVILGKMLLDVTGGAFAEMTVPTVSLVAGFVAAFVSGALACKAMIELVKRGKLIWFALYCVVVGVICLLSSVL